MRISGLGLSIAGQQGSRGDPPVITGTGPTLGALTDGDALSTAVTLGSGYESTAGDVTAVMQMQIDGGSWVTYDGDTVVSDDETYAIRQVVTDDSVDENSRPFTSATVTVSGIAPSFGTSASIASGRQVDISVTGVVGVPDPDFDLTVLTIDGTSRFDLVTDEDPWVVIVPDSASDVTVAGVVTGENNEGTATSSFTIDVTANLSDLNILSFSVSDQDANGDLPISVEVTPDRTTPYTIYIVAVAREATAPSVAQVLELQDSTGAAAPIGVSQAFSTGDSFTITAGLPTDLDGLYDFYAVATDAAPTTSPIASALNVTINTVTPPAYTITGTTDGILIENTSTLTVTGTTDGLEIEAA